MIPHAVQSNKSSRAILVEKCLFRYAVVDLASAPQLVPIVMGRLSAEAQPLLSPDFDRRILEVGPWLVDTAKVPELEPATETICPGVPWGYFVATSIDIVSLRRALRRYNVVELPDPEREVLFRYWDPRVMKVFLQIATRTQKRLLFEFIDRIESPYAGFDVSRPDEQADTARRLGRSGP